MCTYKNDIWERNCNSFVLSQYNHESMSTLTKKPLIFYFYFNVFALYAAMYIQLKLFQLVLCVVLTQISCHHTNVVRSRSKFISSYQLTGVHVNPGSWRRYVFILSFEKSLVINFEVSQYMMVLIKLSNYRMM